MSAHRKLRKGQRSLARFSLLSAIMLAGFIFTSCQASDIEQGPTSSESASPPSVGITTSPVIAETTPTSDLRLDELIIVGMGGYAFEPVEGYQAEVNVSQATISDESGNILVTMTGSSPADIRPVDQLLSDFLRNIQGEDKNFAATKPFVITIANKTGLAADIQGTLGSKPYTGRVAVVQPTPGTVLNIMGMGLKTDLDYWEHGGETVLNNVIASIRFFDPTDSECFISYDLDYGYSPQNPVRVGGGTEGGTARSNLYLENLRGPNFEPVTYKHLRTETIGDAPLKIFELTYPGQDEPAWLYLDEATYEPLKAPAGFKCPSPFAVSAP